VIDRQDVQYKLMTILVFRVRLSSFVVLFGLSGTFVVFCGLLGNYTDRQMMRCFVGYYTTNCTFYIRTYLRGHKSLTPSVLKLTTSLSFAKLVT